MEYLLLLACLSIKAHYEFMTMIYKLSLKSKSYEMLYFLPCFSFFFFGPGGVEVFGNIIFYSMKA